MKDDFEFLRGLANCSDKEQMLRYIEEHQPKPPTNADRVRSMTDEELAKELALVAGWDRKEYETAKRIGIEKVMLDWLKLPAGVKP